MKKSLAMSVKSQEDRFRDARKISRGIAEKIARINTDLDVLCQSACVDCENICCSRATIWFDFKDLLYLYLSSCKFPQKQIRKNRNLSCSCLTPSGCSLKRRDRPFVCTWYICPKQNKILKDREVGHRDRILKVLQEIKKERKQLEVMFLQAVC